MQSTSPQLYIPLQMANKVRYFLKNFRSREWSGPAWYSHTKDENGFPDKIVLEYWHPLHLGDTGSTDWDGKHLMKLFPKLRKQFPKIGKEWVQGNIHSHHGLGAFFSGTDEQQLADGANKNFYYSLVVSHKPGKELAFAVSYPDQFEQIHITEIEEIEFESVDIKDKDWTTQMKWIKKQKKKEKPAITRNGWGQYMGRNGQAALWEDVKSVPTKKEDMGQKYADHEDYMSYNGVTPGITYQQFIAYDEAITMYEKKKISKVTRDQALQTIGVDEHGHPISKE